MIYGRRNIEIRDALHPDAPVAFAVGRASRSLYVTPEGCKSSDTLVIQPDEVGRLIRFLLDHYTGES